VSAPARSRPARPARPAPRAPVDPRVRERWIAARREEGRRRLRVLIVIASVVTVLAAAYGVTVSPLLAVDTIEITGTEHTTPAQVEEAGGIGTGDAMVWIDPDALATRIEAAPWIRTAKVEREWPRTLRITVTERAPVAWAQASGGPVLVLDGTGRVLESADAPPPGLPRLVDLQTLPTPGGTAAPAAAAAIAAAYGQGAGAVGDVSVVHEAAVVHLGSGTEVRLGRPTRIAVKLRAADAVLASVSAGGRPPPTYVDVSVPTNPVTG
jgi:cell division protein FtsQ